jgi:hypothetical protein
MGVIRRVSLFVLVSLLILAAEIPTVATTRTVNAGGDFQAALNAAQPGDEIVLQAGARFVGEFQLPTKPAGAPITIRSSAALPARRLTPADAPLLPTIVPVSVTPALNATGASNWRLDGLKFESTIGGEGEIITLQDSVNIYMDRLLIIGGADGQKRAIRGNGRQITLTRSHIANIWRGGQDSQAFCAWDGAGPYTVTDNFLEAAAENLMFGGANSKAPDRIPSDILVENNHLSKNPAWKGTPKTVKNLFELKSAKRVTVRYNLFEHNWTDAQNGYGILFTVRNDEGGAPWSVVEDVLFERNTVRDTENGINVLGYDSYRASGRTTRVTIQQNLIITAGTFLQVGSEVGTLTLDHNTVDNGWTFAMLYGGDVWSAAEGLAAPRPARFACENLTIINTVGYHRAYGVMGEGAGSGTPGLTAKTVSYVWTNNVLAGTNTYSYPAITWRPTEAQHQAQFNADYTLVPTSSYRRAGTDGKDVGVVWAARPQAPTSLRIIR